MKHRVDITSSTSLFLVSVLHRCLVGSRGLDDGWMDKLRSWISWASRCRALAGGETDDKATTW